jgi:hypothetical protein
LQNKLLFETPYVQDFAASTISDARPVTPFAPASGKIRVVKLHGSHTWINKEGVPIMVIGTNKSKTIAGSWLLTEYKNMFEEALNSGSVRLLVMGYSFKDAHVNKAISTAAASHQCRVFVWNPNHPLDMLKGERTICNGLMGWEPRSIVDVMPSAGGISIADEGVFSEFFG